MKKKCNNYLEKKKKKFKSTQTYCIVKQVHIAEEFKVRRGKKVIPRKENEPIIDKGLEERESYFKKKENTLFNTNYEQMNMLGNLHRTGIFTLIGLVVFLIIALTKALFPNFEVEMEYALSPLESVCNGSAP